MDKKIEITFPGITTSGFVMAKQLQFYLDKGWSVVGTEEEVEETLLSDETEFDQTVDPEEN